MRILGSWLAAKDNEHTYIMKAYFWQYGSKDGYTICIRDSEAGSRHTGIIIWDGIWDGYSKLG